MFISLAIHQRIGSFSDYWIAYCEDNDISYKVVDCYASDIVTQLIGCNGLMWHWAHYDHKAILFARQLTYSLELTGKKVFPNTKTSWHYDDKVGQKYLLESINAPLVNSYVFYDKKLALLWAKETTYPKVFKLSKGAGSENVKLVNDYTVAVKLISRAFRKGFKVKSRSHFLKERIWHLYRERSLTSLFNITKGIVRVFVPTDAEMLCSCEKNYIYFQDYVEGNDSDIRIVVIGQRAFAIKRLARKDDFRASGSGVIIHDPSQIPRECIEKAFHITEELNAQSVAYDFVYDYKNKVHKLLEISYTFNAEGYKSCPGYWDNSLNWIEGHFIPQNFMIEDFLESLEEG